MKFVNYIKKYGVKRTLNDIYEYQIDKYLFKIIKIVCKNKSIKNVIMIESHNDFDCNGGAFYDYLIEHNYNEKYRIVWLLKHPDLRPKSLPYNVDWVPIFKPSLKKNYYRWIAKYFLADQTSIEKGRDGQCSIFLTHGAGGLKNVKGMMVIPPYIDYVLIQSENYAPIQAEQYSLEYPNSKLVYLGYPSHDVLNLNDRSELSKITTEKYKKIILWMPTFRKGGETIRNDSTREQKLGIPLIESLKDYNRLNQILKSYNILLIVKIHPKQDLTNLGIINLSNIIVLTGIDVKKKGIDNYRLMRCADAMISDYSGVAYEYLQLNRPIAYVLSDKEDYKLGFIVDNIDDLIAGHKIYNFKDLYCFIEDINTGNDLYKGKREKLRSYIYKYHDRKSCERLASFMGL